MMNNPTTLARCIFNQSRRTAPHAFLAFVLAALTACVAHQGGTSPGEARDDPATAVGIFHEMLEPHGQWTRDDEHGWVWVPDPTLAGPDFIPYTSGRFVNTNVGMMFLSSEPWGWITYHYGRWAHDPIVGWHWVPGSNWAPAWVGWRRGGGFVGWAPLPPRRRQPVRSAPSRWVFVAEGDIGQAPLRERLLPRERLGNVLTQTKAEMQVTKRNFVRWYEGPSELLTMRAGHVVKVTLPPAGRLVRVQIASSGTKNRDRGAIVIRQPRADSNKDQDRTTSAPRPKPRRSKSIPGDVSPVMPPLDDDERGRRWR